MNLVCLATAVVVLFIGMCIAAIRISSLKKAKLLADEVIDRMRAWEAMREREVSNYLVDLAATRNDLHSLSERYREASKEFVDAHDKLRAANAEIARLMLIEEVKRPVRDERGRFKSKPKQFDPST